MPTIPTFTEVWCCKLCWKDSDGLNHDYDYQPKSGWIEITAPDRRCYLCGAPVTQAINVKRLLDNVDPRSKVWG